LRTRRHYPGSLCRVSNASAYLDIPPVGYAVIPSGGPTLGSINISFDYPQMPLRDGSRTRAIYISVARLNGGSHHPRTNEPPPSRQTAGGVFPDTLLHPPLGARSERNAGNDTGAKKMRSKSESFSRRAATKTLTRRGTSRRRKKTRAGREGREPLKRTGRTLYPAPRPLIRRYFLLRNFSLNG